MENRGSCVASLTLISGNPQPSA